MSDIFKSEAPHGVFTNINFITLTIMDAFEKYDKWFYVTFQQVAKL